MKYIHQLYSLIFLFSASSTYSMELVPELVSRRAQYEIIKDYSEKERQQYKVDAQRYLNVTFSGKKGKTEGDDIRGLKFNEIAKYFCALTQEAQYEVWKHMSEGQKWLHAFAVRIPEVVMHEQFKAIEDVRTEKHTPLYVFMFDGNWDAAEKFEQKPIAQELLALYKYNTRNFFKNIVIREVDCFMPPIMAMYGLNGTFWSIMTVVCGGGLKEVIGVNLYMSIPVTAAVVFGYVFVASTVRF